MTDPARAALQALMTELEAAHDCVCKLSKQELTWRLSIPAQQSDPDLLIGGALRHAMQMVKEQLAALSVSDTAPTNRFDCAACGTGIAVDEDGCCRTCGADATVVIRGKAVSDTAEPKA